MQPLTLLLGEPGTGKTTSLIGAVQNAVEKQGVHPERIAFISYTKAAVEEAKTRTKMALGIGNTKLRFMRTIHSLCFKALGAARGDMLTSRKDIHRLYQRLGLRSGILSEKDYAAIRKRYTTPPPRELEGERFLFCLQYSRMTGIPLRQVGVQFRMLPSQLLSYGRAYDEFREDTALMDFTDLLERYARGEGTDCDVDLAIIDEAQDMSPLQVQVIKRAFASVPVLYIAGDFDQSIYKWSGAIGADLMNIDRMLGRKKQLERLTENHRVPVNILEQARRVLYFRTGTEKLKPAQSTVAGGMIKVHCVDEQLPLEQGTWLLMARSRYQLGRWTRLCEKRGLLYRLHGRSMVDPQHVRAITAYEDLRAGKSVHEADWNVVAKLLKMDAKIMAVNAQSPIWHDALVGIPLRQREYYLVARRRGEKLLAQPRINICTMHGTKGSEADNVAIITDVPPLPWQYVRRNDDGELRLMYTSMTRARKALYFMRHRGSAHYKVKHLVQ